MSGWDYPHGVSSEAVPIQSRLNHKSFSSPLLPKLFLVQLNDIFFVYVGICILFYFFLSFLTFFCSFFSYLSHLHLLSVDIAIVTKFVDFGVLICYIVSIATKKRHDHLMKIVTLMLLHKVLITHLS